MVFMVMIVSPPCLDIGYVYSEEGAAETVAADQEESVTSEEGAVAEEPGAQEEPAAQEEAGAGKEEGVAEKEEAAEAKPQETSGIEAGNVTVNFKGADIRTVLSYISEVASVDIVPAPDVKGVIDLKLTNKPWKTALDIIVRNYGFAYEREGDIIRVVTVDKLKQEELTSTPFTLNYAKAKDIVSSVKDIVSERGKVIADERTNMVLVTDIPTNIYKISEIIARLDRRTPQVLIEARVIETVLDDSEKLGIDWNVKFGVSGAKRPTTIPFEAFKTPFNTKSGEGEAYFPQVQTAATTAVAQTAGGATTTTTNNATSFPSTATGIFSFPFAAQDQFVMGTIDFTQFSAILEMIKSRSNTDIISNPRIATLNNTEALINVGQTLNLPKFERNSSTGKMEITGYEAKDLGIILKVTPHINANNEIVIDLAPQISDLLRYDTLDPSTGVVAPVFSSRQAKTQVMVKDGETIFIGGLIKENNVNVKRKMPVLGDIFGDIPGLGLLFTKKEVTKQKTELIFFITVNLMTVDKDIQSAPKAEKAYVPKYEITQEEDPSLKKRQRKRF